jgi:hypothetical protein
MEKVRDQAWEREEGGQMREERAVLIWLTSTQLPWIPLLAWFPGPDLKGPPWKSEQKYIWKFLIRTGIFPPRDLN